ncbi:MAG: alpha/beta hydrolase [Reichenbachiella sp.]
MRQLEKTLLFLILLSACHFVNGQEVLNLYKDGKIPNAIKTDNSELIENGIAKNVSIPQLLVYRPKMGNSNKTAVLICPGGGYGVLVMGRAFEIAEELTKNGVTAFVLKYRLPNDKWIKDKSIGPIQDAQRAMQIIRKQYKKWVIDPNKVGVMGPSAGGHLAASLSYLYDHDFTDRNRGMNLRPDFSILIYPVISMDTVYAHMGSRTNLLGVNPSTKKQELFSLEKNVNADAPPTFILHANDDKTVSIENSLMLYEALRANKVAVDMRVFSSGEHGFNMGIAKNRWLPLCIEWLSDNAYLNK